MSINPHYENWAKNWVENQVTIPKLPNTGANIPLTPSHFLATTIPTFFCRKFSQLCDCSPLHPSLPKRGLGPIQKIFFEKWPKVTIFWKKKLKSPDLNQKKWGEGGSRIIYRIVFEKMAQNHHILREKIWNLQILTIGFSMSPKDTEIPKTNSTWLVVKFGLSPFVGDDQSAYLTKLKKKNLNQVPDI